MATLFAFVKKEFYHIFRDRWSLIILLLMPVMMLILIGFAMTTEVKGTTFRVLDPSFDESTREIVETLTQSGYFTFGGYLADEAEIDQVFRQGKAGLVLVFSSRFESERIHTKNGTIAILTDGSDPNTAKTLTNYASAIIRGWAQKQNTVTKASWTIGVETRFLYNPAMKGSYNFVPGVLGMILLLICAMMTSISIAREKESGTMEVLLASPMKPGTIILAKTVPYFTISCVNLVTSLLLSVFVLAVPIQGSIVVLIAVSLLYILLSLLIGVMISTIANSQLVALLISGMGLMMPVILLSGMMFPIESMPLPLQFLSALIPTRWYISAMRKIMIKGLGFGSVLTEVGVLSLMAVIVCIISLKKFKPRLE
ncbi:ABC-type multidrug transport system, permease component [Sphaerochaeta pleomorpha str. Grapes]|uniref:ABC-type multidrug transport system, permease component n=1 Tax=Sphaerochaeta pleomorpha (strain ATCC BAA-1885 / DSM 22778 / Grapes) TaxID=158190 RepID=G8QX70_SPHPG|nr:ABC transporter permease [Sphaerochaeta pleomorpha]AEV30655.1 ABC-type multidrug transport system, permease component [Sphaerochaeta pleomorpha str. Grapes]